MCGIAGVMIRDPKATGASGPITDMMEALQRRGPDSAGVALYGERQAAYRVSVLLTNPDAERAEAIDALVRELDGAVAAVRTEGIYGFLELARNLDPMALVPAIENRPGAHVVGIGQSMMLVKDGGSVQEFEDRYAIRSVASRYAVGHTRLATESRVDPMHAQPLWSRYVPDLCVAHNGHITNDQVLRKTLMTKGYRFTTDNDSEAISVYLADKVLQGKSLREAMEDSLRELDGAFTYIAASLEGIGVARDPFAFKPLAVVETDELVAFATEYPAVAAVAGYNASVSELNAGEVRVWS